MGLGFGFLQKPMREPAAGACKYTHSHTVRGIRSRVRDRLWYRIHIGQGYGIGCASVRVTDAAMTKVKVY